MKRLCILLFLFSFHTSFVYAETKQIQLKVDRQKVEINLQKIAYQGTPFFDNGKGVIYCHVRSIPEMIQQDLELIWDESTKTAFVRFQGENKLQLMQKENKIIIKDTVIENQIIQKNNQIYLPVFLLSEAFDVDIQVVSDYDDFTTVIGEEREGVYRKLGYLKNDFKSVGKYIQQNIDAAFTLEAFSDKYWKETGNNVEMLSTHYLLGEFETDFCYHVTSVNGQVIEIRRTGTPLYHFEGEIPSKEKVDAFVDALQKNNKYYFARQEVYKKYQKDNFYLEIYYYYKGKEFPMKEIYCFQNGTWLLQEPEIEKTGRKQ